MEKQEILQKAQQENKGKDLVELDAQRKATNIAFTVGGLTIIAFLIVELIVTHVFHYGTMAGLFVMLAAAFITKYVLLKKKHELIVSICYSVIAIAFIVVWILQLCKVM